MNFHDLDTMKIFSKQHNIKINYIDFDVLSFYNNDYFNYVGKYRCGSPHICAYMKMSELVTGGTILFSGNYLDFGVDEFIDRNNWGLFKYADITKRAFVPYFFIETMELAWSFQKINNSLIKYQVYQDNGYPVIPQKQKTTGFEKIKEYYDNIQININPKDKLERLPHQGSKRNFDILFRNKYEYKYRKDKFQVKFIHESK